MVSGLVRAYVSVVSGEWYHGGGLVSGEWCYSLPGHRIIRGRWFHNPHNPNLSSTTICPRCNLWKLFDSTTGERNCYQNRIANAISYHV